MRFGSVMYELWFGRLTISLSNTSPDSFVYANAESIVTNAFGSMEDELADLGPHRYQKTFSHPLVVARCVSVCTPVLFREDRVETEVRMSLRVLALCCMALGSVLFVRLLVLAGSSFTDPAAGGEVREWPLPYCGAPAKGAEGVAPNDAFVLRSVAIVIRHGDRSAIHDFPGGHSMDNRSKARWRCVPSHDTEPLAYQHWAKVSQASSFVVRSLRGGARLARQLTPALGEDRVSCIPGQLTPRGSKSRTEPNHCARY